MHWLLQCYMLPKYMYSNILTATITQPWKLSQVSNESELLWIININLNMNYLFCYEYEEIIGR